LVDKDWDALTEQVERYERHQAMRMIQKFRPSAILTDPDAATQSRAAGKGAAT
jgi:hypothetical protein